MADDERPDKRPRPQFGELAPEGWVWHPPADQDRLDTSRPAEADEQVTPATPAAPSAPSYDASRYPPPQGPPLHPSQLRRDAPRWNAGWSIALLILGFVGMSYSILVLNLFPSFITLAHQRENLGAYQPAPSVGGILTAGSITMGGIWVMSAALTVWLMARKRVSFYVPLVAGVVAFVVLFVFLSAVITTDPGLMNLYGGISPGPNPTP